MSFTVSASLRRFLADQGGQASTDWMFLSAFVIVLAIAAASSMGRPTAAFADQLAMSIQTAHAPVGNPDATHGSGNSDQPERLSNDNYHGSFARYSR